ncbi:MAG: phosphopentomutase [Rhizobiales bacterium]|nr:phosphopentomutase [Hyphomicrobiales bacterium]MBO6699171.1 phosphopentomutase [Hyphomicrobiales bacterium]MBO6736709.1 phosphopentomutase [Hyphomicrobiales bacterium]MBO6912217.1 phosphopentomutase [Hyphomicrobiales bacterium]MBO6956220.1 phosphopentomutase [Hyphomicrobiales bacterium]
MPRVFLVVLDSVGIGGAPDAHLFFNHDTPDTGANTVGHIAEACARGDGDQDGLRSGPLHLPNLARLGLGKAVELASDAVLPNLESDTITGRYAAATEVSNGKDTPSGHWEIAGVPVPFDWGYFPDSKPAFPDDLMKAFISQASLPGTLCNEHGSGTVVIAEYGLEHIASGKPIVYTSADSVFQIAAHEEHFGLERLYEICKVARKLIDPLNIGRVIARPFVGETVETFKRTANRKDYAVPPPEPTVLNRVQDAGNRVIALGKLGDIFAMHGIDEVRKVPGIEALFDVLMGTLEGDKAAQDGDLVFANFVEFDSEFGHRRNIPGYADALERFDRQLPRFTDAMKEGDLLILTADHGNDPSWIGTDHTRERVPVLMTAKGLEAGSAGVRTTFADIGETAAKWLGLPSGKHGTSIL